MTSSQLEFMKLLQDKIKLSHYKKDIKIMDDQLAILLNQMDYNEVVDTLNATSPKTGYEFKIDALKAGDMFMPGAI